MDALGTLGVALAGGSIGTALTLIATVPAQVKHHDRQVRDLDDDLGQYVSDDMVRLERALKGHETIMAAEGQLDSGAFVRGVAGFKEEALHLYRDQERAAERGRAALRDEEGLRHRVWRRLTRRGPLPALTAPVQAKPLLDLWREPVCRDGTEHPVSDPTKRPLSWAVERYPAGGVAHEFWRRLAWGPPCDPAVDGTGESDV